MEFDATEIANLIKTAVTKRSRHECFFRDQNKKRPTERGRQPARRKSPGRSQTLRLSWTLFLKNTVSS